MDEERMMELESLARDLAPFIAQHLIEIPTIFGQPENGVFIDGSAMVNNTHFNTNGGTITIGRDTFFGNFCSVITGSHDPDKFGEERIDSWRDYPGSINIGDGVWIGSNSIIIGPCDIEDDVVIGAGSVVLPGRYIQRTLYAGVPAVIKRRLGDG